MGMFNRGVWKYLSYTDISDVSGILARAKFYRVVADEAQFIRNRYVSIFRFIS